MINCSTEEEIGKKGKIGKSTDEGVHVEKLVEGVDLGEGGDVHWEAAIREDNFEHFLDSVVMKEETGDTDSK
ncbi:hypothetical protein ACFX1Q_046064 [Malus domestica]